MLMASLIVGQVRARQPQLVMSAEMMNSWEEVIAADANLGGQGRPSYHTAMQRAARDGDASGLESLVSTSGATDCHSLPLIGTHWHSLALIGTDWH